MKGLGDILDGCEADTLLLSGTFEPSHSGHIKILEEGFHTHPQAERAIVLPHNWNTKKIPNIA